MGYDSLQLLFRGLPLLGWRLLCEKISNDLNLETLVLHVKGDFLRPERFLPDYVDADGSKSYWYDYFSNINGLRKLVVEVTSICDTEKIVFFLAELRAQILKGREETGTAYISVREELLHVGRRRHKDTSAIMLACSSQYLLSYDNGQFSRCDAEPPAGTEAESAIFTRPDLPWN